MNFKVVSNSTPLIALSRINRLDIIKELFGAIIVPDAVFIEVTADKKGRIKWTPLSRQKLIKVKLIYLST